MKKFLAVFLAVLTVASLALSGCGQPEESPAASQSEAETTEATEAETTEAAEQTVGQYDYELSAEVATIENPYTEWPLYTLKEGASVEEMRQMAVKVMRDELSIPWTPNEGFHYDKEVGLTRTYEFLKKIPYAGLPYTSSASGIFQWLEFYDMRNGVMFNLPENVEGTLGNSCAASAAWGIAAVAPSLLSISTYTFVPENGAYPVGGIVFPDGVTSLKNYYTSKIIEDNGRDKVIQSYLQIQPADVLISYSGEKTDHAVMAIDVPHVEYLPDGSVDVNNSYVRIQDQRASENFEEVDGYTRSIRGRLDYHMSFTEMYDSFFLAFAPKEFQEGSTYTPATVKLNKEVTDLDSLLKATILSDYRIATVHAKLINEAGGTVIDEAKILHGNVGRDAQKTGYKVSNVLSKNQLKGRLIVGKTYTVSIEVRIATGELITVASVPYTPDK